MQPKPRADFIETIKAALVRKGWVHGRDKGHNRLARAMYDLGDVTIDASYITKLLKGKYKSPGIRRMAYVADALGIPAGALLDAPYSPEMEDTEMAKRIAVLLPQLSHLSDPVEFIRDVAALPPAEQEDIESYVEFKKFKAMTARQQREYLHTEAAERANGYQTG